MIVVRRHYYALTPSARDALLSPICINVSEESRGYRDRGIVRIFHQKLMVVVSLTTTISQSGWLAGWLAGAAGFT